MTQVSDGIRSMELSREFAVSRADMFRAWTDADALMQWWGPKGMPLRLISADVRAGGILHYAMESDGPLMWGRIAYREVVPSERLVFVNSFADAEGNVALMPFMDGFPAELLCTVTFTESAGRTAVAMHSVPLQATESEQAAFEALLPSMQDGFGNALDQLTQYLAR